MKFFDLLTSSDILPISAALLSLTSSIAATTITKKKTSNNKKNSKMLIKWKGKDSEKRIRELITKPKIEERPREFGTNDTFSIPTAIGAFIISPQAITREEALDDKKNSKMSIKWKGGEIDIDNCSEKEIRELITKLKIERGLQENSVYKKES